MHDQRGGEITCFEDEKKMKKMKEVVKTKMTSCLGAKLKKKLESLNKSKIDLYELLVGLFIRVLHLAKYEYPIGRIGGWGGRVWIEGG